MDRVRFKGAAQLRLYEEIIKRWRRAAECGYAKAQFELGASHASGEGVKQDDIRALMWLSLAAAQGHDNASRLRVKLKHRMTEQQIERAYEMERDWRKAHPRKVRLIRVPPVLAGSSARPIRIDYFPLGDVDGANNDSASVLGG